MDLLRNNLENMTLQGYGESLTSIMRCAGIKRQGANRAKAVEMLYDFYTNPESPDMLFKQLNKYEKELLTCIVQSNFHPIDRELKAIAEKHHHTRDKYSSYSYSSSIKDKYFPKDSKLYAFTVKGHVPPVFKAYLEKVIPPYVRTYRPCQIDDIDEYPAIIDRENRLKDFDMLLSFINNNKVSATKAGGYMNKTALLKFQKIAGYDDICNSETGLIGDIRNAGETTVSHALAQMMRCADVIDIVKDRFVLSKNASRFAGMTMPEKAKFLYESYINHGGSIINECTRISAAKLKFGRSNYDLSAPRKQIVSYLKECPLHEWIEFDQFTTELYKADRNLFALVGDVYIRDDYYNQYYEDASWNDFEACAISVIIMEYLATLGAVDVLAEEASHSVYDYGASAYEAAYFRLTDLGAYLFGLSDSYEDNQSKNVSDDEKGFIVQPNFDIVIPNGKDRMKHELFFDRFAEKTVSDEEVSVYKLDFKSMVNALNIGLLIREISIYCEVFSSVPVPDNVKTAFTEWENQSGRIRIRTITAIEADDYFLLEEIKNYRGMNALSEGELANVLILTPGSEKKAKTLIERNKRFCVFGDIWKQE